MLAVAYAVGDRRRPRPRSTACSSPTRGVPSIIVTLGTLAIFRTLADQPLRLADDHLRRAARLAARPPELDAGQLRRSGTSARSSLGAVVLILVLQLLLGGLKWGRWVYAVGSNPDAARQAGAAGRARDPGGVRGLGRAGRASPASCSCRASGPSPSTPATGSSSQSVAAAVVGGVNIFGGVGDAVRRAARRAAHQPARPEPAARAGAERVLARRRPRRADPDRGRGRLPPRQADRHGSTVARAEQPAAGVPPHRGSPGCLSAALQVALGAVPRGRPRRRLLRERLALASSTSASRTS